MCLEKIVKVDISYLTFMRAVSKRDLNRGPVPEMVGNAAIGHKRIKDVPRPRYIKDHEYKLVLKLSKEPQS